MTTGAVSILLLGLLIAGGLGAYRFTRWISGETGRNVSLIAAVAAWTILFGLAPFFPLAIFAGQFAEHCRGISSWRCLVLNVVIFTLIASPIVGFVHGMRASKYFLSRAQERS